MSPTQASCANGHTMLDSQKFCPECGTPKTPAAPEGRAGSECTNGHAMPNRDNFCPQCGARKKVAWALPPPPSRPLLPQATQRPTDRDVPFGLLLAGVIVSLIVVAVLMFTTPNASYGAYYYPNGSNVLSEETTSAPCITPWNNMVGNLDVDHTSSQAQQENTQSASSACITVIHGRQHLAILFIVIAIGCGIGAAFRFSAVRRRTASRRPASM